MFPWRKQMSSHQAGGREVTAGPLSTARARPQAANTSAQASQDGVARNGEGI